MKRQFRDFKIKNLLDLPKKFKYAWEGFVAVFQYELSFRVELVLTICAAIVGIVLHLGRFEWMMVVFGMGFIYCAEFLNTAIEKILDHLHPDEHPEVKAIKDISAAGVMIANITGIIIALFLFLPRLFR